jgi:hypothetical protein
MIENIGLFEPFRFDHAFFVLPVAALAVLFALWRPAFALRCARTSERWLRSLSRRHRLAASAIVFLAFVAGVVQFIARGVPAPRAHDEFSYLLGADTFAHGRLTNPPNPLWIHFESFHIIQQPTYASMYPPGQALVLAAGQRLFGQSRFGAWFGVWISAVILGLVSWWALCGWFPRHWALLGALFVTTTTCWSYWLQSYWGGAVAAIGGALVLGAWPRLKRRPSVRQSILFGLGIAILANTRMYEGFILSLVAVIALIVSAIRSPAYLWRSLLPAALVLMATGCWMMFYCWRVTGDPFLLPYVLNMRTYLYYGIFVWQGHRALPAYHHAVMERLYTVAYNIDRSSLHILWLYSLSSIQQFMGTMLLLPVCALPWLVRSRRLRGLLVATLVAVFAVCFSRSIQPHYMAPVTIGIIGLTVQALRYLSVTRIGRVAAQTLIVVWLASQWGSHTGALLVPPPQPDWAIDRANMENRLIQTGERHLIIVRYSPSHDPNREWVYNRADLAASLVIWARETTPADDQTLAAYFKDRKGWLLEADSERLMPFPKSGM